MCGHSMWPGKGHPSLTLLLGMWQAGGRWVGADALEARKLLAVETSTSCLELSPEPQGTLRVPLVSLWGEGTAATLALGLFVLNFLNKMSFVFWQTMRSF